MATTEISELRELVANYDPIALIAYLNWHRITRLSTKMETDVTSLAFRLNELPVVELISSLTFSLPNRGNIKPNDDQVLELIEEAEAIYLAYSDRQLLAFLSTESEENFLSPNVVSEFAARGTKFIDDVNPEAYPLQVQEIVEGVFSAIEQEFFNTYGFTGRDAWYFASAIIREIESRANHPQAQEDLSYPFIIEADAFIEDHNFPNEHDRFKSFINMLSISLDDVFPYDSPLATSIFRSKPFIRMVGSVFVASPYDLISRLQGVLERLLEKEKQANSRVWQKYQTSKAIYTENKIGKYLTRLFPSASILQQIFYALNGERYEIDCLLTYENYILIIEAKSGGLSAIAKRGGLQRLKTDLKKLIADAVEQGIRTSQYIQHANTVEFTDRNGNLIHNLSYNGAKDKILILNVTFDPLFSFATQIAQLQLLGISTQLPRIMSVNIREFDLLTKHISSPSIFLHYVGQRLGQNSSHTEYYSSDEISYLYHYFTYFHFGPMWDRNGQQVNYVSLNHASAFDDFYLHGGEYPQLKLPGRIGALIAEIEGFSSFSGKTEVICSLLDFGRDILNELETGMDDMVNKFNKDGNIHDYSTYSSFLKTGITVILSRQRSEVLSKLSVMSNHNKRRFNMQKWLAFGFTLEHDTLNTIGITWLSPKHNLSWRID